MNFLLRSSNQTAAQALQPVKETPIDVNYASKTATMLEGLVAEDPFPESMPLEIRNAGIDEFGDENGSTAVSSGTSNSEVSSHVDVTEDEGSIIIPHKEVPENWTEAPDILSFRSLDRSFVFPGEQIQLLACLSACKHDTEIITPFKVAALMNKNGIRKTSNEQNGNIGGQTNPVPQTMSASSSDQGNQDGEIVMKGKIDSHKDVSTGESLLRMEDHKRQTEQLLQRFKDSHFFVRIAESNEPLWSRRAQVACLESSASFEEQLTEDSSETATTGEKKNPTSAVIDRGKFDARTSGGLARAAVKSCSLSNGDIVVLLQVNVGVQSVRDPILEILQFEKYQEKKPALENRDVLSSSNRDPSGDLLKWLLPVDNSATPAARPISPPPLSSTPSIRGTPPKPAISGSSSSQIFSFGHFRSYSMSSLPPNSTPPPAATTPNARPNFDPEDWKQFPFKKSVESGKGGKTGYEGLLSFRGVPLQQERFSVRCGLEGIFTPGRRWRRKIELIQPVEIHTYSVNCDTDDLLCVHVKNVSPANAPDIVVFIDAITIVFEEVSKGGQPLFLPITSIESGDDYRLPNLALRRGEEHSFILKPATMSWKHPKGHSNGNVRPSRLKVGNAASSWHHSSNTEGKHSGSPADKYAVLVSCRCNYTESKLFFKQPTSWRPRISKDLMISVASEMSRQTLGSDKNQLPIQVLTLQASNMTSENLTLTVLAPASFTSPRCVVTLSHTQSSHFSPISAPAQLAERMNSDRQGAIVHGQSSMSLNQEQNVEDGPVSVSITNRTYPIYHVVPNSDLGCTHLWLQSRVPLGCVPSQSTATVKIEVLPLTDGIITLDSLKIEVKEKGLTYVPEQSLKINSTSSIATGIF